MNPYHIHPDDLALFALQFLPAEETAVMRAHLERCGECRAQLGEIQGDLALLALTAELHSPPAAARDRLVSQVAREPKPRLAANFEDIGSSSQPAFNPLQGSSSRIQNAQRTPSGLNPANWHIEDADVRKSAPRSADEKSAQARQAAPSVPRFGVEEGGRRQNTLARILPWTGWAVAAGIALMLGQAYQERDSMRNAVVSVNHQIALLTAQTAEARRLLETLRDPAAERVTLTLSKQKPVPQGRATYVPGKGALVFLANNLEPLEPLKTYELWVIPSNGQSPIPAGTFQPDEHGNASVLLPQLPTGVTAKAFGVTVEDEGGSPTPTMPILLAGAASSGE